MTWAASALARELARLPGVTQRLLAAHVADAHGRCRACTTPGTGLPGAQWPCALHFYASVAERFSSEIAHDVRGMPGCTGPAAAVTGARGRAGRVRRG